MNLEFQRRVDRFVGVPLCRLLSLLPSARDEAKDTPPPRKILVILLSEMGSLVLAQPMFAHAGRTDVSVRRTNVFPASLRNSSVAPHLYTSTSS